MAASVWIAPSIVKPFGACHGRDDAAGHRAVLAKRVADGDDGRTDLQIARRTQRHDGQGRGRDVDLQQRDVSGVIDTDHLRLHLLVVREGDGDRTLRAVDDVRVAEDVALLVDHEARTEAAGVLDADDARALLLIHLRDAHLAIGRCGGDGSARAAGVVRRLCHLADDGRRRAALLADEGGRATGSEAGGQERCDQHRHDDPRTTLLLLVLGSRGRRRRVRGVVRGSRGIARIGSPVAVHGSSCRSGL